MVELFLLTVYEENNQKGIVVIFTIILLVLPFLISGLQLNHGKEKTAINEERAMLRAQEDSAIAKAIAVLNSDEAGL